MHHPAYCLSTIHVKVLAPFGGTNLLTVVSIDDSVGVFRFIMMHHPDQLSTPPELACILSSAIEMPVA